MAGKLKYIVKVFCFVLFVLCVCQVKTQLYQPPELPCLGPLQVHVSSIGEDGLIYVRTHNAGNCSCTSLTDSINLNLIFSDKTTDGSNLDEQEIIYCLPTSPNNT